MCCPIETNEEHRNLVYEDSGKDLAGQLEDIKHRSGNDLWKNDLRGELKDLIAQMVLINPAHRLPISEVVAHPWLKRASV